MRPIAIDFARPGVKRALLRTSPAAMLLAVVTAGALLLAAWSVWQGATQLREERAKLAQAEHRLRRLASPGNRVAEPAVPGAQAHAVNAAVAQLNLPWGAMFAALEEATPDHIALVALEPDPARRVLKGTAEARTGEEMIGYIEQLKRAEFFPAVILVRHDTNEQDANRPLRFQFEATWKAPSP